MPTSCSHVIDEVFQIWFAANLPTTQKHHAVAKLKKLYESHVKAGKNKARETERQTELETEFTALMTKLFDVAHADLEHIIRIPEDYNRKMIV